MFCHFNTISMLDFIHQKDFDIFCPFKYFYAILKFIVILTLICLFDICLPLWHFFIILTWYPFTRLLHHTTQKDTKYLVRSTCGITNIVPQRPLWKISTSQDSSYFTKTTPIPCLSCPYIWHSPLIMDLALLESERPKELLAVYHPNEQACSLLIQLTCPQMSPQMWDLNCMIKSTFLYLWQIKQHAFYFCGLLPVIKKIFRIF